MNRSVTSGERGFSAIETLLVVAIMGVISGMAVLQIGVAQPSMKGDGAMRVVMAQMRTARELAISERRYMRVVFTDPGTIQIIREEVPGPSTTLIRETQIEGGIGYRLIEGVPDTPDAFGKSAAVSFGVAVNVKFTPDGTLVNQNGTTINGSVFLALPDKSQSVRAVTVLGSTGRIRGYRWDGANWKLV